MIRWTGSEIIPSSEGQGLHVRRYVLTDVCHVIPVSKQCFGVRCYLCPKWPLHPPPSPEVPIFEHLSALRIYNNTTLTTQESINMGTGVNASNSLRYETWDEGEWSRSCHSSHSHCVNAIRTNREEGCFCLKTILVVFQFIHIPTWK